MTTRHQFLADLHELIKPEGYLEIGVQFGTSLALARQARLAVGVDPVGTIEALSRKAANTILFECDSDYYFQEGPLSFERIPLDLAFIDGLHNAEQVLRDVMNTMALGHTKTIIACDDMLPRSDYEATREIHPGDWAGDCWKVWQLLDIYTPTLPKILVNTQPTGIMLVVGHPNLAGAVNWDEADALAVRDMEVPGWILDRRTAYHPGAALEWVKWQLDRG